MNHARERAWGDRNQLEMALLNLAVNARDAMPEGGTLRIFVEAERVGDGHRASITSGQYLRLAVADTGLGMDEATLARAVEPFFSTKGVGKGTGLGLSMVHGLCAQLGGTLTLQSRLGEGTTVELWVPVSAAKAATSEYRSPAAPSHPGRNGLALLVHDEELVRSSIKAMLADLGYQVREADSAEEGLRLVESGLRPDLLLTDHLMPGMSGAELARTLRARLPGLAVLLMSGYADVDSVALDLPRLIKPFRLDDLVEALVAL
jgi:CheY-like chemotaxis protein